MVTSIWLPAWSVLFISGFMRWHPYQLAHLCDFVFKWRLVHQSLTWCTRERNFGSEFIREMKTPPSSWVFLCNTWRRSSSRIRILFLHRVRQERTSEKLGVL